MNENGFQYFGSLIDQASTYAGDIDFLIFLVLVIVGVCFLIAEAVFLYFIVHFRAKPGQKALYITGKEKSQKRWIFWPHMVVLAFDLVIIAVSFKVWYDVKLDLPPNPDAEIRITGQQWAWTFQHPGTDGELDTADDIYTVDELRVANNHLYHFKLEATDVLHSFSVPVWRIKQDAIPGRSITGWFEPTKIGEFDVQCAEICGFGHGVMAATVLVESPEDHAAWIAANSPVTADGAGAPTPDVTASAVSEPLATTR